MKFKFRTFFISVQLGLACTLSFSFAEVKGPGDIEKGDASAKNPPCPPLLTVPSNPLSGFPELISLISPYLDPVERSRLASISHWEKVQVQKDGLELLSQYLKLGTTLAQSKKEVTLKRMIQYLDGLVFAIGYLENLEHRGGQFKTRHDLIEPMLKNTKQALLQLGLKQLSENSESFRDYDYSYGAGSGKMRILEALAKGSRRDSALRDQILRFLLNEEGEGSASSRLISHFSVKTLEEDSEMLPFSEGSPLSEKEYLDWLQKINEKQISASLSAYALSHGLSVQGRHQVRSMAKNMDDQTHRFETLLVIDLLR